MVCYYCGIEKEIECLRPYGPSMAMVCFPCIMADSLRKKIALIMLNGQLKIIEKLKNENRNNVTGIMFCNRMCNDILLSDQLKDIELLKEDSIKFRIDRTVTGFDGTQTFECVADSKEKAFEKFKKAEDIFIDQEVEVTGLSEVQFVEIYKFEDGTNSNIKK